MVLWLLRRRIFTIMLIRAYSKGILLVVLLKVRIFCMVLANQGIHATVFKRTMQWALCKIDTLSNKYERFDFYFDIKATADMPGRRNLRWLEFPLVRITKRDCWYNVKTASWCQNDVIILTLLNKFPFQTPFNIVNTFLTQV